MKKILIVEDNIDIHNLIKEILENKKYKVIDSYSGTEAFMVLEKEKIDLILLDLMLPGINGFQVCKQLAKYSAPVIMLTARNDVVDKILGLELGADDYMTKPFNIRECITRVNVALRRIEKVNTVESENVDYMKIGNIDVYKEARRVSVDNEEIKLKPKELDLLFYLIENSNRALTREKILDSVWGYDYFGDPRTVDVHIRRLRQKLKDNNSIETVFGTGYMLRTDKV